LELQIRLQSAINAQDWKTASELSQQLSARQKEQTISPDMPPVAVQICEIL
jgi:hypothetical protein